MGPKMGPGPAATAPTWDWRRKKIVPNWCFDSVRSQSLKHTFFARCLLIAVLSLHLIPAHSISQDVSGNLASSQARQVRRCNSRGMFAVCGRVFPRQRLWVTNTDDDQMMTVAKWEMFLCLISASASAFTRVRLNILDGQRRIWTYTGVSYNFSIVMCSEQTITDTICILEQKNPPNCSSWCMIGKVHHLWLQYSQHLLHHSKVGSLQYNWLLVRMNIARKLKTLFNVFIVETPQWEDRNGWDMKRKDTWAKLLMLSKPPNSLFYLHQQHFWTETSRLISPSLHLDESKRLWSLM